MVERKFLVHHNGSDFAVDYDTDDGFEVFKFQLFSLTSLPPDDQKIIGVDGDRTVSTDSDLIDISEKLRLVSISEDHKEEENGESSTGNEADFLKSDEELARMLQAEDEALMFQQYIAAENNEAFEHRVRPYIEQVRLYEDPMRQEAARKTVPVDELEEKALVSLAKEGEFNPSKAEQDHAFLLQLLFWFKQSFSWVNAPPCDSCGKETISQGMAAALPSELRYRGSRVEIYRCKFCSMITRFPRYNDPLKLIETRRGRCGEWANCFTLYCRAFGFESRLILDFTDHVWTECFSLSLGRWMHLDPCEGAYDKPLLYEKGWNKKLNYVIAIAKDGLYDVTKRYTRKWHEVLSRRIVTTESALTSVLDKITKECRSGFSSQVLSVLKDRDEKEREAIERELYSTDDASISLPGRQSGDKEWRKLRSEIGSDSLSCSSCPVRLCIDEHVTRVYDAFLPLFSHFVKEELPKSVVLELLGFVGGFLKDLQKSPFRTRKASLDLASSQAFVHQALPFFYELLNALSLKKVDTGGNVDICLAGNPVKTSIALPVALDALDYTIHNLKNCENLNQASLTLPLLKLSRIHSGSVLASGEELPFGIATSAFDGIQTTKWEEPNGARGCWLIYKASANLKHKLVAYELMSANDAPERDPMDWVLEGSDDGGSSWNLLDKQTKQKFDERFQHRTYKIASPGPQLNAFRFRFLAVRDSNSNSRLQIGSIDLYSGSN
ncbi:peptide-N(4)-(N-acetyl-beta-glucosaminyl)asparagine amidase [Humulus lupulus]|uniref:peptide-N(4)-(N-acetyl-beta- glucosaminyl)asparagine amidase n=1 Tax=Humulus lupulus TaxID=3486 RepID=UPI002B41490E|nr:peptide-N(4)-(N-acetyl-beta-glucosaminyl)asparagine amidase [Humulus lupulus]